MPVSPGNARRRSFGKIVSAAHIDGGLTPHDLRHTMNSIADAAGVTEKVRSERLGHADSQITKMVIPTPLMARREKLQIGSMRCLYGPCADKLGEAQNRSQRRTHLPIARDNSGIQIAY
jgi:hypothetical protein